MKKSLLILSTIAAMTAGAQITINSADGPNPGVGVIVHADTLSSTGNGGNGTAMTWNFGGLTMHTADSLYFEPAANYTVSAAYFPGSNIVMADPADTNYQFFSATSTGFFLDGYYANMGFGLTPVAFNPPFKYMQYPSTYGTSYTNTAMMNLKFAYPSPPIDSAEMRQKVYQTSAINAWGTLTTPSNTFNVIRQDWKDVTNDSIFIKMFGTWSYSGQNTVDSTMGSRWWATGQGFPVMEMEMDATTGAVDQTSWLFLSVTLGANEQAKNMPALLCYPNPANDEVNFSTNQEQAELVITDMQGKVVEKFELNGNVKVNTAAYPAGVYYYMLNSKNGTLSGKMIVSH